MQTILACFAAGLAGCTSDPVQAPFEPASPRPSFSLDGDTRPDTILNRYVVVLQDDVRSAAEASALLVARVGGLRFYVYETALKGFAVANLPPGAVDVLRRDPLVKLVEASSQMLPQQVQTFSNPADSGRFGLDRIDQRNLPLDWQHSYSSTGLGVHIYIIDSGVRGDHQEWGFGRVGTSAAFIKWSWNPNPTIDSQGHGTAVAGAAAGTSLGVAKQATIHSVRIDDGEAPAYSDDIIAGLNWVAENREMPAVANLSYGANSQAMSYAVAGLMNAGVTFVYAADAGFATDACNWTTQLSGVITVGASRSTDYRASYSPFGVCIDLFAPGGDIEGYFGSNASLRLASNTGTSSYRVGYGTSFAAPVAAGVAALRLQENPSLTPWQVEALLVQTATSNVILNAGTGTPNRLLYSEPPPPPGPPFPVSISGPTQIKPGATCTWYATVSGGTAPYTYNWSSNLNPVGTYDYYTGAKPIGSGGVSFSLKLTVTDALNGQGIASLTVTENAGAQVCPL